MTVPGPTKVLHDWAQKPVLFRVANVLCEESLETCERGCDEAGEAERPIAAILEDGPQADSEAEKTSLPGATAG
ncbi:hypothetical protein E2C01_098913 [Portunus trituberculatus]|uniref:Uncharacterized protein n=1 Tax=Portunus trituberculatus TaxID=210409 RepID=A0A5B7K449_PORTR|nr:hypothetical protein [Portunus trituberculatus]